VSSRPAASAITAVKDIESNPAAMSRPNRHAMTVVSA
jgi:hypothetical protein